MRRECWPPAAFIGETSGTRGDRRVDEYGGVESVGVRWIELGLCAFGSSPVALFSGPNY